MPRDRLSNFSGALTGSPGGSGVYDFGGGKSFDSEEALSNDAELRRRDVNDFKQKNQFMSDLTNRPPNTRMQSAFNPNGFAEQPQNTPGAMNTSGMHTVMKEDPDRITPFQAAGLNIKREDLANDRAKITQTGKLGEEKLGLAEKGHELDVKKNQNIYDTKHADMQRKIDEANTKLDLAERQFQSKQGDAEALSKYHQAQMDATKAQHDLDNSRKDQQLEELKAQHKTQSDALRERLRQSGKSTTKTSLNATGTEKNVETTKGDSGDDDDPLGILK